MASVHGSDLRILPRGAARQGQPAVTAAWGHAGTNTTPGKCSGRRRQGQLAARASLGMPGKGSLSGKGGRRQRGGVKGCKLARPA